MGGPGGISMSRFVPRPAGARDQLQLTFLAILPRIRKHGEVYFRRERCHGTKEECLAEMTALSWQWFVRLLQQGKDPTRFVSAIATFAARAVQSGRRLCGQERVRDVLSPVAQRRKGFAVSRLPDFSTLSANPLTEALADNTVTRPDEAAAFRIDFPAWLAGLDDHKRRVAMDLMMGERTIDVAARHGHSAGRISQLRREFLEDWARFCGEGVGGEGPACQE
jgi:hypothetical protein